MYFFSRLRISFVALALFGLCGLLVGCNSSNPQTHHETNKNTLRIGYLPITDHFPLMTAAGNDTFEGINVEPVRFSDWPSLAEALKAKQIDGAHMLNTLAMKMVESGFDIQVVALSHRGGIGLSVNEGIQSLDDLYGKTIGVPSRFSPHYMMLHHYLTKNGFEVGKDVKILDLAPPDMVSTLAAGGVDGFIVSEPFLTLAESRNVGKTFALWDEMQIPLTNGLDCVVALHKDIIDQRPEVVQEYVKQILKAGQFIEDHVHQAAETASPFLLDIDPDLIVKAVDDPPSRATYDTLVPQKEEFQRFQDYMIKIGLLKNPVNIDQFVNTQFAK